MNIEKLIKNFGNIISINNNIININNTEFLLELLKYLKLDPEYKFEQLIDLAAIDYLHYGITEWSGESATRKDCKRVIQKNNIELRNNIINRFAVVYNLLSLTLNHRILVKCLLSELRVPSVVNIWPVANWYEREAFDLFGIEFLNHPDLRKILTDYNTDITPFRKDFSVAGEVEVRFDGKLNKVVYEPIEITTSVSVPKVIRNKENKENITL